jgi:hypothetical protein
MLRRTGFKRRTYHRAPPAPLRRVERSGVISSCASAAAPIPKPEALRNRRLLDLARGMECLLRIPGVCRGGTETTVACHSNWCVHGKAGARKADDCWSCWGCAACHRWLDQGPAPEDQKWSAFMEAMKEQLLRWTGILESASWSDPDRAAAKWAVDHLDRLA